MAKCVFLEWQAFQFWVIRDSVGAWLQGCGLSVSWINKCLQMKRKRERERQRETVDDDLSCWGLLNELWWGKRGRLQDWASSPADKIIPFTWFTFQWLFTQIGEKLGVCVCVVGWVVKYVSVTFSKMSTILCWYSRACLSFLKSSNVCEARRYWHSDLIKGLERIINY